MTLAKTSFEQVPVAVVKHLIEKDPERVTGSAKSAKRSHKPSGTAARPPSNIDKKGRKK